MRRIIAALIVVAVWSTLILSVFKFAEKGGLALSWISDRYGNEAVYLGYILIIMFIIAWLGARAKTKETK